MFEITIIESALKISGYVARNSFPLILNSELIYHFGQTEVVEPNGVTTKLEHARLHLAQNGSYLFTQKVYKYRPNEENAFYSEVPQELFDPERSSVSVGLHGGALTINLSGGLCTYWERSES